jgi:hypothetical protein
MIIKAMSKKVKAKTRMILTKKKGNRKKKKNSWTEDLRKGAE